MNYAKAPFPWFGGKRRAASAVWAALGDVPHYVEPFAGSLAVLLNRPHTPNRTYYSETVNDIDGLLVNAWRAIVAAPDEVAEHASWPVSELDLTARHMELARWRAEGDVDRLAGTPDWYDARLAGWWLWGIACWIGGSWCQPGSGPWVRDPQTGKAVKAPKGDGVPRQLPHLGSDGQGVHHAGLREQGVPRQLPHLGGDGQGVNRPQLREQGVPRQLPHLADNGQGVNRPQLREPADELTMPRLREWMRHLAARLRHVRERLWMSPHCLQPAQQRSLFGDMAARVAEGEE